VGDAVKKGDKLAEAADGLSVPAYASVDGKVTYADREKVVIECK
jgi:Na+-translocating ferredoxin:NAD+ oxidoreductase RnfC subunit